jgi:hypothetical protein
VITLRVKSLREARPERELGQRRRGVLSRTTPDGGEFESKNRSALR